jgi:hypothetical protein
MFLQVDVAYLVSITNDRGGAMNKLRLLTAGMLLAASAALATAAEEQSVSTVTVMAKRHGPAVPASEGLPPRADVQISLVVPTDMPEAEIDYHLSPLSPVGAPPLRPSRPADR